MQSNVKIKVPTKVRSNDVADGLSKTYLVGERAMLSQYYETITGGGEEVGSIFIGESSRAADNPPIHDPAGLKSWLDKLNWQSVGMVTPNAGSDVFPFGSAHPSTWNMVFCDGSVHSLSYNISLAMHQALASRAAGDSPNGKEY